MKKVQDFVAGLARNRKSTAEIKKIVRAVYGGQGLEDGLNLLCHYDGESW
jgi:hypothetical protein